MHKHLRDISRISVFKKQCVCLISRGANMHHCPQVSYWKTGRNGSKRCLIYSVGDKCPWTSINLIEGFLNVHERSINLVWSDLVYVVALFRELQ